MPALSSRALARRPFALTWPWLSWSPGPAGRAGLSAGQPERRAVVGALLHPAVPLNHHPLAPWPLWWAPRVSCRRCRRPQAQRQRFPACRGWCRGCPVGRQAGRGGQGLTSKPVLLQPACPGCVLPACLSLGSAYFPRQCQLAGRTLSRISFLPAFTAASAAARTPSPPYLGAWRGSEASGMREGGIMPCSGAGGQWWESHSPAGRPPPLTTGAGRPPAQHRPAPPQPRPALPPGQGLAGTQCLPPALRRPSWMSRPAVWSGRRAGSRVVRVCGGPAAGRPPLLDVPSWPRSR